MKSRTNLWATGLLMALGSGVNAAEGGPLAGPVPHPLLQQLAGCPSSNGGQGGPAEPVVGGHTGPKCHKCGGRGCSSCGPGPCGTPLFGRGGHFGQDWASRKEPFVVNLCPGACFGYFQTQWRRWDEVCPYPYQGSNVSDAPRPPVPYLGSTSDRMPPRKTSDSDVLPKPRPIEPMTEPPVSPPGGGGLPPVSPPGGGLPSIPLPGKF
jgi:hypothetical protein